MKGDGITMIIKKKHIRCRILFLLMASIFLSACIIQKDNVNHTVQTTEDQIITQELQSDSTQRKQEQPESVYAETKDEIKMHPLEEDEVEKFIMQLTLEEKVAQMFVVTPDALTGVSGAVQAGNITRNKYEAAPVGGFILMEGNIKDPGQLTALTTGLKEIAEQRINLLPFICVDEEGGRVTRIASNSSFPVQNIDKMSQIGATGDPQKAYEAGLALGEYLSHYGINVDFAPDADVLLNPENSVIGSRSFGSDPELVSSMVSSEIRGLHEKNVAATVKHFPGHGYTQEDSHDGLAYSNRTLEEISTCELLPFQAGIEGGVEFVMVGHISLPAITESDSPATLSYDIVTSILREQMGYQGIVITDAMNMGAISNLYSSENAAVQCIQAGCDMILMPSNFYSAYKGLLEAVRDGRISEERIDESVKRIITTKWNMQKE